MSSMHSDTTPMKAVRLESLDALRGIALLGILFVNFSFFAMPDGSFGSYINLRFPSQWDRGAQFLIDVFCHWNGSYVA